MKRRRSASPSSSSSDSDIDTKAQTRKRQRLQAPAPDAMPTISFRALERAHRSLRDFCDSYFMFVGFEPGDLWAKPGVFSTLVWLEGSVYHLDEQNEDIASGGRDSLDATPGGRETIESVLRSRGLWDDRVRAELDNGFEFWRLERRLCAQLLSGSRIDEKEALLASSLKSFDYRLMNLVLHKLADKPVQEQHLRFLRCNELLADLDNDLYGYEKDVVRNSFNVLRCLVAVHGPEAAPLQLVERIAQLERDYDRELALLPADLRERFQRRERDAMRAAGDGAYMWSVPAVIVDERRYRAEFAEFARSEREAASERAGGSHGESESKTKVPAPGGAGSGSGFGSGSGSGATLPAVASVVAGSGAGSADALAPSKSAPGKGR